MLIFTGTLNRSCTADIVMGMHADTYYYAVGFDNWFLDCNSHMTAEDLAEYFLSSLCANAGDMSGSSIDGLTEPGTVPLRATEFFYQESAQLTTSRPLALLLFLDFPHPDFSSVPVSSRCAGGRFSAGGAICVRRSVCGKAVCVRRSVRCAGSPFVRSGGATRRPFGTDRLPAQARILRETFRPRPPLNFFLYFILHAGALSSLDKNMKKAPLKNEKCFGVSSSIGNTLQGHPVLSSRSFFRWRLPCLNHGAHLFIKRCSTDQK